jgi:hypothetical protein
MTDDFMKKYDEEYAAIYGTGNLGNNYNYN